MNNQRRAILLVLGAIVIVVGLIITRPWTYFQQTVVDEAFPFDTMTEAQQEAFSDMPEEVRTEFVNMSNDESMDQEMVLNTALAQMEDDTQVDEEAMPEMSDEPQILAQGNFVEIDPVHGAEGTATIFELSGGSRVLRLEEFRSTNGPQLHVILTEGTEATTFGSVGENYVDLGPLKGNVGNQNYVIPEDVDLSTIQTVVIYCMPFHVVFSTAQLS